MPLLTFLERYGTSKYSKDTLQMLNASIVAQLFEWKSKLPPSLQLNLNEPLTAYPPSVLLLQ